jgi:hypothetical protein
MFKNILYVLLVTCVAGTTLLAQPPLIIEGNGLFRGTASTNLDIISTDDNTNSLMRFGDNSTNKVSMGYNGNNDYFNFSTASTLAAEDLTIGLNGRIGINTAPATHRMLINQNSSPGSGGAAHLALIEDNTVDFARMRFTNEGDDGYWELRSTAIPSSYQMEIFYDDGFSNDATLLTLNGDKFVGIHQTMPEAYFHIKQQSAGVNALTFVNNNNDDEWNFRIGSEDILVYFNNSIRGGFDVSTGNYNNFPPSPALAATTKMQEPVLKKVMQLQPKLATSAKSGQQMLGFNPQEVGKVNPDWVVPLKQGTLLGLDYLQLTVLAIKTVQEQQQILAQQEERIVQLKERRTVQLARMKALEEKIK